MSQPTSPPGTAAVPAPRLLVVGAFDDEVRALQAVEALDVWRRANRRLRISPIAVAGRRSSGSTSCRTRGVLRPRRGALIGLLVGVVLLALPAAGAAGLAGWALGSVVLGLGGLVGAVPDDQVGVMVLELTAGSAALAALVAGAVGALVGCLVGLVAGLIDTAARGLSHAESARTLAMLDAGSWAAVARAQGASAGPVRDELARLGAVAAVEVATASAAAPAPAAPPPAPDRPSEGAHLLPGSRER